MLTSQLHSFLMTWMMAPFSVHTCTCTCDRNLDLLTSRHVLGSWRNVNLTVALFLDDLDDGTLLTNNVGDGKWWHSNFFIFEVLESQRHVALFDQLSDGGLSQSNSVF